MTIHLPDPLEIPTLHAAFRAGTLTPAGLAAALCARIAAYPDKAVFITLRPTAEVIAEAQALSLDDLADKPLFGIPFVVKDNIDVACLPTTAACPDFAYTPSEDAIAVARLRAAGAIVLGKANLDQFATGLNGTRSPYGAPRSVFNADYISGGSSSGSAVAVAAGLCVFALGTDTAGSGRVPAMLNNLIGLKPSIGRIAATGLVPACKSLDCISIFANSSADAMTILNAAEGADDADAYSRHPATRPLPSRPRAGILAPSARDFAGDADTAALYTATLATAQTLGWEMVEIDYTPFREIAAALYGASPVAERLAAIRDFIAAKPEALDPTVRHIIEGATRFTAADAYADIYRLQALRRRAQAELACADILLLPTAPTSFTVAAMRADPLAKNATLGLYTNFVNLLDLAAIALPAGFTPNGLPFGVTLIGPAFSEAALATLADALHVASASGVGKSRARHTAKTSPPAYQATLVVAGAHLSGMVLNHELTSLGAELIAATHTAPDYKLYALATTPPKPGLAHSPGSIGPGIAVELWGMSEAAFARFIAALPAPMGIGRVTLADGTTHPGFLCEAYALNGAEDITAHGGWRAYRTSLG
ncbi:MAG: allophanate hydrolase [Acidocella sp.]|nr:allophanate hydrolase [Acidocella sp.]